MNKSYLLVFCCILFTAACLDNGVNPNPFGVRGEVTGIWTPLMQGDTLDVYVYNENNIHLGNPEFEITIIQEADPQSFQVWTDSNYARDSANVYFPIELQCEIIDDAYTCYSTKYIVEGAVSNTFRYLGNGFATDGNELFLDGIVVRGNNSEGF